MAKYNGKYYRRLLPMEASVYNYVQDKPQSLKNYGSNLK